MAEITWEKPKHLRAAPQPRHPERLKFLLGGGLILAAVLVLLVSGTLQGARFFITVDELLAEPAYGGQTVRISGAVDGESIEYDSDNAVIRFEIANIPSRFDDLASALQTALADPRASRLSVRVENSAMPDLLRHEAQAILTGTLTPGGIFEASELLLKCPSRFEETVPEGLSSIPEHR